MKLSEHQARAVTLDHPTILTVACPGSGKTTTLVERIAHLLRSNPDRDPRGMVAITFTNAAASELQKRLSELGNGADYGLGYCGTLHGYMLRLLKTHGAKIGLKRNLGVLDEEQATSLIEQCVKELNYKGSRQTLDKVIAQGPLSFARKATVRPEELVARNFHWTLRQNGLLTFDALLWYGWKLITEYRDAMKDVTHVFVDEYQDSGRLDAMIYGAMERQHRFFVGDCDQAVFGWRGATIQNFLNLSCDPGTRVVLLEDNYRCGARICAAAQRLIEHNAHRVKKRTRSATGEDGEITVAAVEDAHSELFAVAGQVKKYGAESCAVLLRTNHLVHEFTRYLIGVGIPVATKKRQDRPHDWAKAKLLLALLNDPENDIAAYWFLEAQHGAKKANEAKLKAMASGKTVNEFCLKIPPCVEVDELDGILGKAGISDDSREAIARARQGLPEGLSLADLILTLAQTEESTPENGHGVIVTTIHSAKGREFETVILPAFEEEVFIGHKENGNVEEERRLAYVAFTRAKRRLIITHCAKRKTQWGFKPEPATPSRFIKEAGL